MLERGREQVLESNANGTEDCLSAASSKVMEQYAPVVGLPNCERWLSIVVSRAACNPSLLPRALDLGKPRENRLDAHTISLERLSAMVPCGSSSSHRFP